MTSPEGVTQIKKKYLKVGEIDEDIDQRLDLHNIKVSDTPYALCRSDQANDDMGHI